MRASCVLLFGNKQDGEELSALPGSLVQNLYMHLESVYRLFIYLVLSLSLRKNRGRVPPFRGNPRLFLIEELETSTPENTRKNINTKTE